MDGEHEGPLSGISVPTSRSEDTERPPSEGFPPRQRQAASNGPRQKHHHAIAPVTEREPVTHLQAPQKRAWKVRSGCRSGHSTLPASLLAARTGAPQRDHLPGTCRTPPTRRGEARRADERRNSAAPRPSQTIGRPREGGPVTAMGVRSSVSFYQIAFFSWWRFCCRCGNISPGGWGSSDPRKPSPRGYGMSTQQQSQQSQQKHQQITQTLQRLTQVKSPEEAQASLVVSPTVMAYEARWALQQMREFIASQDIEPSLVFDLVEPLTRAVGWAEGLAFAFDRTGPYASPGTNGKQGVRS